MIDRRQLLTDLKPLVRAIEDVVERSGRVERGYPARSDCV